MSQRTEVPSVAVPSQPTAGSSAAKGWRNSLIIRAIRTSWQARVGLFLVALIVAIAIFGPLVAPYSPTESLDVPLLPPNETYLMGTDFLGRDVFSRFLNGGTVLVAFAFISSLLSYVIGVPAGIYLGLNRGKIDLLMTAVVDFLISFPTTILGLVLLAAVGTSPFAAVLAILAAFAPRVLRIVRSSTIEVCSLEFVEAAVARGESSTSIIIHDILPNILSPILADYGTRVVGAIILFSAFAYLGLGPAPPSSDWALTISQNMSALMIQPWAIVPSIVGISILAMGANLVADAVARSVARSNVD